MTSSSLLGFKLFDVADLFQCTVAQESFHYRIASRLLHQACFVAKSMGLHQQNNISFTQQTPEEAMEYNQTFWVLYIVDKAVSLTIGQHCCLPMYDCDVSSPTNDISNPFHSHFIARVELAAAQEDSYHVLYSSQARRMSDFGRSGGISQLDHKLHIGAHRHESLRDNVRNPNDPRSPCPTLQAYASAALGYHFFLTRLLVHRAVKRASDWRQCCSDARACINMLQRLNSVHPSAGCSIIPLQ